MAKAIGMYLYLVIVTAFGNCVSVNAVCLHFPAKAAQFYVMSECFD